MAKFLNIIEFVLVSLSVAFADDIVTNYNGYTVYKMLPTTRDQLKYLHDLAMTTTELDFWTFPQSLNASVDIMVAPHLRTQFLSDMKNLGIKQTIMIEDTELAITNQKTKSTRYITPFKREAVPQFWSRYQTLQEIFDFLAQINQQNPSITSIENIGRSYENRDLRLIKIGTNLSGNTKQIIFIDSAIHAREWISPAVTTYLIQTLIDGYNSNDADIRPLVERFDWYILPVANPDGYSFTHTNTRLWRKTRSPNSGSTCIGTDPNRNFNFQWNQTGSSPNPCSETYAGSRAFSEPEVQVLSDYILAYSSRIITYFCTHSYSQLFMYPWGYTSELTPDRDDLHAKATAAVNAMTAKYGTRYTVGNAGSVLYAVSGGARDWGRAAAGIAYSYTIELRDTGSYGFTLPTAQIIPSGDETTAAYLAFARTIA